jgi:hypothetical protein
VEAPCAHNALPPLPRPPGAMLTLAATDAPSPTDPIGEGGHAPCANARQTLPKRAKPRQRAPRQPSAPNEPTPPGNIHPPPQVPLPCPATCHNLPKPASRQHPGRKTNPPITSPSPQVCQISKRTHRPCHTPSHPCPSVFIRGQPLFSTAPPGNVSHPAPVLTNDPAHPPPSPRPRAE